MYALKQRSLARTAASTRPLRCRGATHRCILSALPYILFGQGLFAIPADDIRRHMPIRKLDIDALARPQRRRRAHGLALRIAHKSITPLEHALITHRLQQARLRIELRAPPFDPVADQLRRQPRARAVESRPPQPHLPNPPVA